MAGTVDVVARTYHTENGVEHLEGEAYTVDTRALAETLFAIGFVSIEGFDPAPDPPPVLGSLSPATAAVGAASFTLHVIGDGFVDGDVILWNGAPVATTFVSATDLSTPIDMTAITVAAVIPVSVQTADALGSNALDFTVTAA
jgi:hypothetical protein